MQPILDFANWAFQTSAIHQASCTTVKSRPHHEKATKIARSHLSSPQILKMSYVIAGRRILNEHLALGVYALTGVGAYLAMSGDSKPKAIEKPVAANSS